MLHHPRAFSHQNGGPRGNPYPTVSQLPSGTWPGKMLHGDTFPTWKRDLVPFRQPPHALYSHFVGQQQLASWLAFVKLQNCRNQAAVLQGVNATICHLRVWQPPLRRCAMTAMTCLLWAVLLGLGKPKRNRSGQVVVGQWIHTLGKS